MGLGVVLFENIALGASFGLAIGLAIGVVVDFVVAFVGAVVLVGLSKLIAGKILK